MTLSRLILQACNAFATVIGLMFTEGAGYGRLPTNQQTTNLMATFRPGGLLFDGPIRQDPGQARLWLAGPQGVCAVPREETSASVTRWLVIIC